MHADEFDHIRADVQQAILEANQHDPTVTLEILWRLFESIGQANRAPGVVWIEGLEEWTDRLLRDVQLRAISKIPYGEPVDDEPARDPEERL